jgi:hypothetical protein
MAAAKKWGEHTGRCAHCTNEPGCPTGSRLFESFTRIQDAYLNRLRKRS